MVKWFRNIMSKLGKNAGVSLIIILAALMLEAISGVQYYYTKNLLKKEQERTMDGELSRKVILVKSMLNTTENVLNSHREEIRHFLPQPDSILVVARAIMEANRYFEGVGVAYVPNYFKNRGRLCEPWPFRSGDSIVSIVVGDEHNHDYTQFDFYKVPSERGTSYWCPPYLDDTERKSYITTYSIPIVGENNKLVGVAGVDLSLNWLGDTLNNRSIHPSSFSMLLAENGDIISAPGPTSARYADVQQVVRLINDSAVSRSLSSNGRVKVIEFTSDQDKRKAYIHYTFMKGEPRWQLAVVCYDDELFADIYKLRQRMFWLMFLGLALLGYIVYRFLKNNMRLYKAEVEKEKIDGELRVAQTIQSEMLPKEVAERLSHGQMKVKGLLNPAKEVGGDLYDYFVRDEKLFFCIGDVSGKGVPSALVMAVVHSLFRSVAAHESNPARIMQAINETSCHGNETNMFVTFFVGVLDLPTGKLRYCNAGHDTPLFITDKATELPVEPHFPLGLFADFKYETQELLLAPGTIFLLYTDGLTEAMNPRHEQFGLARVKEIADNLKEKTPSTILATLETAVHEFVSGAEQSDDLTMLAVQFTPSTAPVVLHKELTVANDVAMVSKMNDFVKGVCGELQMGKSETSGMILAIEEAVVNVMNYAYDEGVSGDVSVVAEATSDLLKFVITDAGRPFAPTDAPDVDTTLSAEDRKIGGLGIFLVRQLMDTINYERIDGKNVLTLKKKLNNKLNDKEQ